VCRGLRFPRHDISHALDRTGRYDLELDREFPLVIKLFHFASKRFTRGPTWHERLELFVPLDGRVRFRMGDCEVWLDRGDLLVVDNLKLHQVVDSPELNTRVLVVSSYPELVYGLGSPAHDYGFLLPFYAQMEGRPHLVRATEPLAAQAHAELAELLACYFGRPPLFQIGCKAMLLRLLHLLAVRFRRAEVLHVEFVRQRERAQQFSRLLGYIETHYAERLAVEDAALMVAMSQSRFCRAFKRVAGMPFISYLTHVRLSRAARLLRQRPRRVVEIATETGFADQSYFVRQFRKHFGQTPTAAAPTRCSACDWTK
jgi:AraC-like DNA-binding protein